MSRVDVIAAARTSRLDGKRAYRGRSWKHGSVHVVEGEVHGHVKPNGEMRARTTRARRQKPPDPPRSTKGPAAPRQMRALLSPAASPLDIVEHHVIDSRVALPAVGAHEAGVLVGALGTSAAYLAAGAEPA